MYFLGSDHPKDILRIIKQYPFFQDLYQDIIKFRYQPKELITMFSEALRIMDQNAVEYMVDKLKAEMSRLSLELSEKNSELSAKNLELAKKDSELKEQNAELEKLRSLLKQNEKGES